MITATLQALPAEAEDRLRQWLRQPAAETLARVVESYVKLHQAEALNDAVHAHDLNDKLAVANASLQHAQRYDHFIEVWRKIVSQPESEPFQTVKLT